MKNFLIFIAGFVSGVIFLFLIAVFSSGNAGNATNIPGLTLFDQPAEVIDSPSFEVLQVIGNNALANAEGNYGLYTGMVVFFIADENVHYYDDQIINVPNGKCVRQIGTYQYETKVGYKTVPAVVICDILEDSSDTEDEAGELCNIEGLTIFDHPADVIDLTTFEVSKVIGSGHALARAGEDLFGDNDYIYTGLEVLFLADEKASYYDGKIINVPRGRCLRQIGTYQIMYKTVPVVAIYDK